MLSRRALPHLSEFSQHTQPLLGASELSRGIPHHKGPDVHCSASHVFSLVDVVPIFTIA